MRFEILELAGYDKAAAEILIDAVADNDAKYELLTTLWHQVQANTVADKASQFKDVIGKLYTFTGDDETKLKLIQKILARTVNSGTALQVRAQTALDEAGKLLPLVTVDSK